jgi:Transposase IS4
VSEEEDAVEADQTVECASFGSGNDEAEVVDVGEQDANATTNLYMSKWYKLLVQANKRRVPFKVVEEKPAPRLPLQVNDLSDIFKLFLNDVVLDIVTNRTNEESLRVATAEQTQDNWKEFTTCEVKAYIGLLILAGVFHGAHEPLSQLWSDAWSHPIFKAVANEKRFSQLFRLSSFDERDTREQRRSTTSWRQLEK